VFLDQEASTVSSKLLVLVISVMSLPPPLAKISAAHRHSDIYDRGNKRNLNLKLAFVPPPLLMYKIVTGHPKARIVEPEEMPIAKQWPSKHSRDSRYTQNNRGTIGNCFVCGLCYAMLFQDSQEL
jgi:hypothetical protein